MATKVKPCRIKATGTPQAGYVPKYVDEDTFQWGTGGGGSDIVYATQAEYNALLPGAESDGKHYFIYTDDTPTPPAPFTPGADTLAYYRMISDLNDYSGNNKNLTGTATFSDNKATISSDATISGSGILNGIQGPFTISAWSTGTNAGLGDFDNGGPQWFCTFNAGTGARNGNFIMGSYQWKRSGNQSPMGAASDFVLLTCVYDGSSITSYKNGVQFGDIASTNLNVKGNALRFDVQTGTWGEIIIEKKAWLVQDILDYYDAAKSLYGIS